jgi:hypothetical protein
MKLTNTLLFALCSLLVQPLAAERTPQWLLTDEEIAAEAKAAELAKIAGSAKEAAAAERVVGRRRSHMRSAGSIEFKPGHPKIELVRPENTKGLTSPFSMELRFVAAEGSRIDAGSFRVYYGRYLPLDITKRVEERAEISEDRARVNELKLKPGSYAIEVAIADIHKRESRLPLEIEIRQ